MLQPGPVHVIGSGIEGIEDEPIDQVQVKFWSATSD